MRREHITEQRSAHYGRSNLMQLIADRSLAKNYRFCILTRTISPLLLTMTMESGAASKKPPDCSLPACVRECRFFGALPFSAQSLSVVPRW